MKKHNLFKVVIVVVLVALLLTWFFPITYFQSSLIEDARAQAGIFDIVGYFLVGLQVFSNIPIYILTVGGLYGVLHNISGYRNLLDEIVKKFKGKEHIFLVVVMALFAIMSSMAGLSLALFLLFPFVISIVLLMGYNKITAAMVTVGSVVVGLIGTVFSASNIAGMTTVITTSADSEVVTKLLLLVIGLVLLVFNVLSYAKEHKEAKAEESSYIPVTKDKKETRWPVIIVLDLIVLIMVLGFVSWESVFKIDVFSNALESVTTFKVFKFELFGKLLGDPGNIPAFGAWTLNQLTTLLLLGSGLLAFLYRMKLNDYLKSFMDGAKRAIKPAVLVALIYMVLVISVYHPVLLTLLKPVLGLTKGLNVLTMSFVSLLTSFFSVEFRFAVSSDLHVFPYMATLFTAAKDIPVIAIIWQAMYGLAMLFAPTSIILMATLGYLHIPYGQWMKAIFKLLLEMLVVLLVIFAVIMFI